MTETRTNYLAVPENPTFERADGWTGRYCLTLSDGIRDLQAGWR